MDSTSLEIFETQKDTVLATWSTWSCSKQLFGLDDLQRCLQTSRTLWLSQEQSTEKWPYCSSAMLHTLLLEGLPLFCLTIYTGFCPKANHTYNLKFWVERHCTHMRDCGKPTARWPIFFPEYVPRCVNTAMNRATSSAIQELKIASTKSWWSDWGFENFQYDIVRTKLSYI